MIFGRGGEEIEELERAGIPVSVVPGITSALAAAARLGVSLTHRDAARSVRFVTGHARDGRLPEDLDWTGLADPRTTLMVYMGGRTATVLAGRLIAAGLPADTPCVAVASVSTSAETRWIGTLGGLGNDGAHSSEDGPILIGIGTVFAALLRSAGHLGEMEPEAGLPRAAAAAGGRP